MALYDDEVVVERYQNSVDTVNLLENDTVTGPSQFEQEIVGDMRFIDILTGLEKPEFVVLALCLYIGLRQSDVARILHVNPSTVNRWRISMGRVLLDTEEMQEKDW